MCGVCVCVCPVADWWPRQSVFLPLTQGCWDGFLYFLQWGSPRRCTASAVRLLISKQWNQGHKHPKEGKSAYVRGKKRKKVQTSFWDPAQTFVTARWVWSSPDERGNHVQLLLMPERNLLMVLALEFVPMVSTADSCGWVKGSKCLTQRARVFFCLRVKGKTCAFISLYHRQHRDGVGVDRNPERDKKRGLLRWGKATLPRIILIVSAPANLLKSGYCVTSQGSKVAVKRQSSPHRASVLSEMNRCPAFFRNSAFYTDDWLNSQQQSHSLVLKRAENM